MEAGRKGVGEMRKREGHDLGLETAVPEIVYTVLKPNTGKKICKTKTDSDVIK